MAGEKPVRDHYTERPVEENSRWQLNEEAQNDGESLEKSSLRPQEGDNCLSAEQLLRQRWGGREQGDIRRVGTEPGRPRGKLHGAERKIRGIRLDRNEFGETKHFESE